MNYWRGVWNVITLQGMKDIWVFSTLEPTQAISYFTISAIACRRMDTTQTRTIKLGKINKSASRLRLESQRLRLFPSVRCYALVEHIQDFQFEEIIIHKFPIMQFYNYFLFSNAEGNCSSSVKYPSTGPQKHNTRTMKTHTDPGVTQSLRVPGGTASPLLWILLKCSDTLILSGWGEGSLRGIPLGRSVLYAS